MTRKQIISELIKDNPTPKPKTEEHVNEMELFKKRIEEQNERLKKLQDLMLNSVQSDMTEITGTDTDTNTDTNTDTDTDTNTEV